MATSLESILSGTAPPPEAEPKDPPALPESEPDAEPGPNEPPPGDNEPDETEPDPAAPPAADQNEPEHVPYRAFRDERRKRQELEKQAAEASRRVAEYEQMLARYAAQTQPPPQPPPPPPNPYVDPQGYAQHLAATLREEAEAYRREVQIERVNASEERMRAQHADYDAAQQAFIETAMRDERLKQRMFAEANPAAFAYSVGKNLLALREIGENPAAFRERVLAEERERLRAEAEEPQDLRHTGRSSLPPSLATARDTSGRFAPADRNGMTPLKDILRAGRR